MGAFDRQSTFAALRTQLQRGAFAPQPYQRLSTGVAPLDAALRGGIPRGSLSLLEGRLASGCSWLLASLLAHATREGFAALLELPHSAAGYIAPPALQAAGVNLGRLVCLQPQHELAVIRAAEWLARSGSLRLIAVPAFAARQALWRRIEHVAQEQQVAIVAVGPSNADLRAAAQLRLRIELSEVHWNGPSGPLGNLCGASFHVRVMKQHAGAGDLLIPIRARVFAHGGFAAPSARYTDHFATSQERTHADSLRYYMAG